jgi:hypothetical protein
MTSVRSIIIATLVTSVVLAGAAPASDPASDQPGPGGLWAAMKYCRTQHAKNRVEREKYANVIRELKTQVWKMPRASKQRAFDAKKSIDRSGTFQGRKLDPQECAKLHETAKRAAARKSAPSGAANPEQTGEKQ